MESYKTVLCEASDELTEKRSRFIGYVRPVANADEANAFIAEIKSRHHDARHNVYAYVLKDGNYKKYSDDGEPQGTAGLPMLELIEKSGLYDVCVVVTRYFGGILLGTGGLVRAYTNAAKLALEAGGVALVRSCSVYSVECDYGFHGKLMTVLSDCGATVESTDFTDRVTVGFYLPAEESQKVEAAVFEASGGRFKPNYVTERWLKTKI